MMYGVLSTIINMTIQTIALQTQTGLGQKREAHHDRIL
jgi:hypothetical protein